MRFVICFILVLAFVGNSAAGVLIASEKKKGTDDFTELISLNIGSKYRRLRVGVKTDFKETCQLRVMAREQGEYVLLDSYESPQLNKSFVLETPPETVTFEIKGKCMFSVFIWGEN